MDAGRRDSEIKARRLREVAGITEAEGSGDAESESESEGRDEMHGCPKSDPDQDLSNTHTHRKKRR